MYLIQTTLIVAGFLGMINGLFDKFNTWDNIGRIGSQSKSMFIYNLTQCKFCMNFWISVLITIATLTFTPFSWQILNVPFIVNGITHLIAKK